MPTPTSSLAPAPLSHTDTDPALPFPQPSQSYLTDFTIADISCPSSGKRHVGSGLCPEIKQYAVTGKKQKTKQNKTTHNSRLCTHTHIHSHMVGLLWPHVKKDKQWQPKVCISMWRASLWNHMGSLLLTTTTLITTICLCGNRICSYCLSPPPAPFAVSNVPSSICVQGMEVWGGEFVKSSISCQLEITHILLWTAPAGNPVMLLPSCSSMLLILFSEGNRIFGGLSVKGAEKNKRRN